MKNAAGANTLRGYRGVGDITFDLDSTRSTDIGWVLFEMKGGQCDDVRGVIGTFNHYATLLLVRLDRAKRPFRIQGLFDNGTTGASEWTLKNVSFTGVWVHNVTGFIGLVQLRVMVPFSQGIRRTFFRHL